jgi:UDP-N-acetyl-D-mannosaminuronate dehydrogenase
MQTVSVIGLGEVGTPVLEDFCTHNRTGEEFDIYGMDVSQKRVWELRQQGYNVGTELVKSDVYIICVYTTDQVFDVLKQIETDHNTIISIESTIRPDAIDRLRTLDIKGHMVLFPHRYNPNDPEHRVFNLDRVMGGRDDRAVQAAMHFFTRFMDSCHIHIVSFRAAGLAKVVENAYRFMEISLAEYLKLHCDRMGIDFDELRKAINTKWNTDIKEARDGIGGHCLPKDMNLFRHYMRNDPLIGNLFNLLYYMDAEYKSLYGPDR